MKINSFRSILSLILLVTIQCSQASAIDSGPLYGQTIRFHLSDVDYKVQSAEFQCDTCMSTSVVQVINNYDAKLTFALPVNTITGNFEFLVEAWGKRCSYYPTNALPFTIDKTGNMIIAAGSYEFQAWRYNEKECPSVPKLISIGEIGDVIHLNIVWDKV